MHSCHSKSNIIMAHIYIRVYFSFQYSKVKDRNHTILDRSRSESNDMISLTFIDHLLYKCNQEKFDVTKSVLI